MIHKINYVIILFHVYLIPSTSTLLPIKAISTEIYQVANKSLMSIIVPDI